MAETLRVRSTDVTDVRLGTRDSYRDGVLELDREALTRDAHSPSFANVEIDVARPGESCRITQVFDVASPYVKVEGSADFPGVIGRIEVAGRGVAQTLDGCVVSLSTDLPERASEIIDMTGPAAELGEFGDSHVVAIATERASGVSREDYLRDCKLALLRVSMRVAQVAADSPPTREETYGEKAESGLPRVAAVVMLHSHQVPTASDEPILYGHNVRGMLPVLLRPAEVVDGAWVAGFWSFNLETYHIQRKSIVHELLGRHGREIEFVGVVATVAHSSNKERERCTRLATNTLQAMAVDGAILTKVGGGIPQSDLMLMSDRAAEVGVETVSITVEAVRGAKPGETLSVFSPNADALVSAGGHDMPIEVPAVDRVLGPGSVYAVADRTGKEPSPEAGTDATAAQSVRVSEIAGAVSQLGGTRLRAVSI